MRQLKITLLLSMLISMVWTKAYAYTRYDCDACIDGIFYKFNGQTATVTYKYVEIDL